MFGKKVQANEANDEVELESELAQSEVSMIPNPTLEAHLLEVENLKWQIQYENKLFSEMKELLEHKVSNLLADKEALLKQIS